MPINALGLRCNVPYFEWVSVDAAGSVQRGKIFSKSADDLVRTVSQGSDHQVYAMPRRIAHRARPNAADRAEFFHHLSSLTQAGMRIPDAMGIIAQTVRNPIMREFAHAAGRWILAGIPLSEQMAGETELFAAFDSAVVHTGEETGSLSKACYELSIYYERRAALIKQVKSALFMPAIAASCMLVVTFGIFAFVVPRFATLLISARATVPPSTQLILSMSAFMTSWRMPVLLTLLFGAGVAILAYARTDRGRRRVDGLFARFALVKDQAFVTYLSTLGLLVRGMVPVPQALAQAAHAVNNCVIRGKLIELANAVAGGMQLADAAERYFPAGFEDAVALIRVGQASGSLGVLSGEAAHRVRDRLFGMLAKLTQLVQPVMLIGLGCLVAWIMIAVYTPLLTLAQVME